MVRKKVDPAAQGLPSNCGIAKNVGPVRDAVLIPFPKETGGVVVWRGANGTGKTTMINCQARVEGRNTPPITRNDSSTMEGFYKTPFGVNLSIGTMVRRVEETRNKRSVDFDPARDVGLTCNVLGDDFSIEDIVNPKEQSPASADRRTISAMVRLAKKPAEIGRFMWIFEDEAEFDSIVGVRAREATDLVDMARFIKLDLEEAARSAEEDLQATILEMRRLEGAVGQEQPPEAPINVEELKAKHQESVLSFDAVKRRKEDSDKAFLKLERLLRQQSELQPSELDGESLKRDRQVKSDILQAKIDRAEEIRDQISRLQEELESVEGEIEVVQKDIEVIDANYRSISDRENLAKKLEEDIAECRSVEVVTAEDVAKCKKDCDDLIQQISSADSLNEKIQQFQALLYCRKEVRVCEEKAKSLRQAGKDAEGVLTETIKELGSEIEVQFDREGNPRLMVHSEDRSRLIFFFDLSKGQKLAYTLPIAINAVGRGGVFTFPQESWEGLDGVNRAMVVRMCCEHGVIAVTGECDEEGGNLRAEVITTENIQESTGAAGGDA